MGRGGQGVGCAVLVLEGRFSGTDRLEALT